MYPCNWRGKAKLGIPECKVLASYPTAERRPMCHILWSSQPLPQMGTWALLCSMERQDVFLKTEFTSGKTCNFRVTLSS